MNEFAIWMGGLCQLKQKHLISGAGYGVMSFLFESIKDEEFLFAKKQLPIPSGELT